MTIEQFDNTGFAYGMRVRYDGKEYDVCGIDFPERLITIKDCEGSEEDDPSWKRCENCEIV